MTRYVLKDRYRLRGWDKLPYAVVDTRTGRVSFPPKVVMEALLACDGTYDFDSVFVPDSIKAQIAQLVSGGYVDVAHDGATVADEQRYLRHPNRYVPSVHWSLTGRCNYRCRHCYMFAPHGRLGELSHASLMEIARQIGECGIPAASLTGGEPLIRSDFFEIVDALLERGTLVTQLYTNGALLNEEVLDGFERRGVRPTVVMSFDGTGWHDWMRGVPGAETASNRAFELCAQRGFDTRAQVTLHGGNIESLRDTVNHLKSLGCGAVRANCVDNTGEWVENSDGRGLSYEEYFDAVLRYIPSYYADGMPLPLTITNVVELSPARPDEYRVIPYRPGPEPERRPLFACARQSLLINADGRPAICDSLDADYLGATPIVSDDPSAATLCLGDQLRTEAPYMQNMDMCCDRLLADGEACATCPYVGVCWGGCHAMAYRSSDSVTGPDPVNCLFFKGGWARRLVETMRDVRASATSPIVDDPLFFPKSDQTYR